MARDGASGTPARRREGTSIGTLTAGLPAIWPARRAAEVPPCDGRRFSRDLGFGRATHNSARSPTGRTPKAGSRRRRKAKERRETADGRGASYSNGPLRTSGRGSPQAHGAPASFLLQIRPRARRGRRKTLDPSAKKGNSLEGGGEGHEGAAAASGAASAVRPRPQGALPRPRTLAAGEPGDRATLLAADESAWSRSVWCRRNGVPRSGVVYAVTVNARGAC